MGSFLEGTKRLSKLIISKLLASWPMRICLILLMAGSLPISMLLRIWGSRLSLPSRGGRSLTKLRGRFSLLILRISLRRPNIWLWSNFDLLYDPFYYSLFLYFNISFVYLFYYIICLFILLYHLFIYFSHFIVLNLLIYYNFIKDFLVLLWLSIRFML